MVQRSAFLLMAQLQLKNFLSSVHGFDIKAVHTMNMEGKKKRNPKTGRYFRKPDWKKAYVLLNDALDLQNPPSSSSPPKSK